MKTRLETIDTIRGITLASMILYHFMWDLVYIAGFSAPWYLTFEAFVWEQTICWSFILLSGFCASFASHPIRRGLLVSLCGLIITAVTHIVVPEDRILFGILTFMGAAMILTGIFRKVLLAVPPVPGLIGSALLFVLFRFVQMGFIGFWTVPLIHLPDSMYSNLLSTFFGFAMKEFYSSDYFSILPWIFLYLCGFYIYLILKAIDSKLKGTLLTKRPFHIYIPLFNEMGKKSLLIYMLHQPVLYGITLLLMHLK